MKAPKHTNRMVTDCLSCEELERYLGGIVPEGAIATSESPFTPAGEKLGSDGRGNVMQFAIAYGMIMGIPGSLLPGTGALGADHLWGQIKLHRDTWRALAISALYTRK